MTRIILKFHQDVEGKAFVLEIQAVDQCLGIVQYLDILEGWLTVQKKQHESAIKEYEDLKKSGKIVSMARWKKPT